MRLVATLVALFLAAAFLAPVAAHAQAPPDSVVTPPPATPEPAPRPSTPPPTDTLMQQIQAATHKPVSAQASNNFFMTLSGSASMPNDSFGERAEMGSQFLAGVHGRVWDRLTLGLTFGASNWAGADIQSYHATQVTLDARYSFTLEAKKFRPFVQVGFGSYQVVSEVEPDNAEKQRASENSMGVNYGGGLLFPVGNMLIGPVVLYHSAGAIPEIGSLTGIGDCKFISYGVEFVFPMGR
jgi:hypothetical protein